MYTDQKFPELIAKFYGVEVRGETVVEHELAHAFESMEKGFKDRYIVVTPYLENGVLTLDMHVNNLPDPSLEVDDTALAPRIPSHSDITVVLQVAAHFLGQGDEEKAFAALSRVIGIFKLKDIKKLEGKLQPAFFKEYRKLYPKRFKDAKR